MDIQYTYQLISLLKNHLSNIEGYKAKYIILTHNLEFFNVLSRNKVITSKLLLETNIVAYKDEILVPYDYHLNDVWFVSLGKNQPTHTTPNSIRHIIETIGQFCGYGKSSSQLYDIICESEELNDNLEIYVFMQDLSHGNFRMDIAYTSETIKEECKAVINYIRKKFPEQISALEQNNN